MTLTFRRNGPKVFVSYSFGNSLAANIAAKMADHGFKPTLLDDSALLGQSSLRSALDAQIEAAEIVVPVIDQKAARPDSRWVIYEIEVAKQSGKVIIPVVHDGVVPPEIVSEIPYAHTGNWEAAIPAIASQYARLPLDETKPFQLDEQHLISYLSSSNRFIRVVLDSDGLVENWRNQIPSEVERLTASQPEYRKAVEAQCHRAIDRCSRNLNLLDPLIPHFRKGMETALQSYGPDRLTRMLPGWQSSVRLTVGSDVMLLAQTGLELWGKAQASVESELEGFRQAADGGSHWPWAAKFGQTRPVERWLDVCFVARDRIDFRGKIPALGDTRDMVRCQSQPLTYFEKYQWADYGLPQLLYRAVNFADCVGDQEIADRIAWNLEEYDRSGLP